MAKDLIVSFLLCLATLINMVAKVNLFIAMTLF